MNFPQFVIRDPKHGLVGRSLMAKDWSYPTHIIGFNDYGTAKFFTTVLNKRPQIQQMVKLHGEYNVRVEPLSFKTKKDIIEQHMSLEIINKIYFISDNPILSFDTSVQRNEKTISMDTTLRLEDILRLSYNN